MTLKKAASPQDVIAFWRQAGPDKWFTKDEAFDAECRRLFLDLHQAAAAGDLAAWEASPDGALALLILLDQMPRNMFRGSRRAYATDERALAWPTAPFRAATINPFSRRNADSSIYPSCIPSTCRTRNAASRCTAPRVTITA
jgi:uncharacterized protein (DUF924 family)